MIQEMLILNYDIKQHSISCGTHENISINYVQHPYSIDFLLGFDVEEYTAETKQSNKIHRSLKEEERQIMHVFIRDFKNQMVRYFPPEVVEILKTTDPMTIFIPPPYPFIEFPALYEQGPGMYTLGTNL